MSKIGAAIYEIHRIEELAGRDQWVNRIHPLVKLILTVLYLAVTVSFSKYDVLGLAGMAVYPLALFILAELSFLQCLKRLRLVLPLVCLMGIFNPLFDTGTFVVAGVRMSMGVLSMITLILKGIFCVLASYLLIATTTIEQICYALRLLRVPRGVVTQLLLTYRYLTLLLAEGNRVTQAYALRAPGQKGVQFRAWGSLAGQFLLRSADRANEVYESMLLRGYEGEYAYIGESVRLRRTDLAWLVFWAVVLAAFRRFPVLLAVGGFAGGMFG